MRTATDPIFALLAAERQAWKEQTDIEGMADKLFFAARAANPELMRVEKCHLPGEMGELYRRSTAAVKKASKLTRRLSAVKPRTIAGAIALLKYHAAEHRPSPLVENALVYLEGNLDEPGEGSVNRGRSPVIKGGRP